MQHDLKIVVFACAALTACSSDVYEDEIASFKDSTDAANKAVSLYLEGSYKVAQRNTWRRLMASDGRIEVELSDACSDIAHDQTSRAAGQSTCIITVNDAKIESEADRIDAEALLKAFTAYAENLEEVTKSEDLEKADKAIGKLSKSVTDLMQTADSASTGAEGITAAAGPVTSALHWAGANYLNFKRHHALKRAINLVDPVLRAQKEQLNRFATAAQRTYAQRRVNEFVIKSRPIKVKGLVTEDDVSSVELLYEEAQEIADVVNSDPEKIFNALIKAHGELRKSLDDPRRQIKPLVSAMTDFKDATDEILKSLEGEES